MKRVIRGFALLTVAALLAWAPVRAAAPSQDEKDKDRRQTQMSATQGQPVPFEVVKQGNNAFGIKERAEQLIQNEADWARVWTSLESTTVPRPPVQPVDFAKQTLIAVFAGEKRTGGYKIRIEAVRAQAKKLVVDVLESSPGAGMVATMAFTSPYQVISVPKGEYELHVNRSSK